MHLAPSGANASLVPDDTFVASDLGVWISSVHVAQLAAVTIFATDTAGPSISGFVPFDLGLFWRPSAAGRSDRPPRERLLARLVARVVDLRPARVAVDRVGGGVVPARGAVDGAHPVTVSELQERPDVAGQERLEALDQGASGGSAGVIHTPMSAGASPCYGSTSPIRSVRGPCTMSERERRTLADPERFRARAGRRTMTTVGEQVVRFASDLRWEHVPGVVRRRVALLLLDHAAVVEAGRVAPAARIAADHASEAHGGDAATALLDGRLLSVPGAAWANGVLANVLDYDDGHRLTKGHPGAMIIPSALAVAESVRASPTAFFEAVLVGYEVAIRVGIALHAREQQYHASAAWGSVGVAVAAARLLGLDAQQITHAVGIAEYHAPIALMPRAVADPAMTKDTCGWGGLIGTTSALLAARGFTGLGSAFLESAEELALGERWEVDEIYLKPYPCCRWSQPAIDAALRLRVDPHAIEEVTVRTFAACDLLSTRTPSNTEEMQYSLVWPVATALARGRFGIEEVLDGFADPGSARIAATVRIVVDPALTDRFPARRVTEVTVHLSDGSSETSGEVEADGEPGSVGWNDVVNRKADRFLGARHEADLPGTLAGCTRGQLVAFLASCGQLVGGR